jgi:hypothetical protein
MVLSAGFCDRIVGEHSSWELHEPGISAGRTIPPTLFVESGGQPSSIDAQKVVFQYNAPPYLSPHPTSVPSGPSSQHTG